MAPTVVNTHEGASRTLDGRFKTFYLRLSFEGIGENIVILKIKKIIFRVEKHKKEIFKTLIPVSTT